MADRIFTRELSREELMKMDFKALKKYEDDVWQYYRMCQTVIRFRSLD